MISGPARALLTAERRALNFLCRTSGIATATASIVAAVKGHKARIIRTRKTTPGLRIIEKYAMRWPRDHRSIWTRDASHGAGDRSDRRRFDLRRLDNA